MAFDYFYGRGTELFAFYQVPKILITDNRFADITTDAKLLYSLMLDRSSLSAKNGWLDKEGRVYIFYTLEQIMSDMHCANQKATKLLKELETKGLIERQKRGQGKVTRIYVRDFATGLHGDGNGERQIETHESHDSQTHENRESRDVKISSPDSWKSCTSNTDMRKTDMRKTDPINLSVVSVNQGDRGVMKDSIQLRRRFEEHLREKLNIVDFMKDHPFQEGKLNEILKIMVEVLCSNDTTIRISGKDRSADVVKDRFMEINEDHLECILDCFEQQTSDIHNMTEYLKTTIYNAPLSMEHYYAAKAMHDMAHRKEIV